MRSFVGVAIPGGLALPGRAWYSPLVDILKPIRDATPLYGPMPMEAWAEKAHIEVPIRVDPEAFWDEHEALAAMTLGNTHKVRTSFAWRIYRYMAAQSGMPHLKTSEMRPEEWDVLCPNGSAEEWCRQAWGITRMLRMRVTDELFPLFDEDRVHLAFPSREELEDFETELIEAALEHYVASGSSVSFWRYMKATFGLDPGESRWAIDQVALQLRFLTQLDMESTRAVLQAKIEEFTDTSKVHLQLQQQIQGLKTVAQITGINRSEPEDDNSAWLRAAAGADTLEIATPRKLEKPMDSVADAD
jgi:hypothetical protein